MIRAVSRMSRHLALGLAISLLVASPLPAKARAASSIVLSGSVRAEDDGVTLSYWGRDLATLRASVGAMSPTGRRDMAAIRLDELNEAVRPADVHVDSAQVGDLEVALVTAKGQVLFAIFDADLEPGSGDTRLSVAERAREELEAALEAREQSHHWPLVLKGVAWSLLAIVALIVGLLFLGRLVKVLKARALHITRARPHGALVTGLQPTIDAAGRGAVTAGSWAVGAGAVYLCLTFVFQQFPYSYPWGQQLGEFLLTMLRGLLNGMLGAVPGLLTVVVIFVVARIFIQVTNTLFRAVELGRISIPGIHPDTADATERIVTFAVWVFAFTAAYPNIPGSDTDAFKAIGVLAGLLVSMGSVGLVNQMMSGLVIVYARALKPGELIRTGNTVGVVQDVGLLATKLLTPLNEEITIPNAVLVGSEVTNFTRLAGPKGAVVATHVSIGYDAPWRQVHAMLLLAAARTKLVLAEPKPYVLQRQLSDFSIDYELRVVIQRAMDRFVMLSELHAHIQDAFNEFGVQIMTPHFEGQPDGQILVPKSKWHAAPAGDPEPPPSR